MKKANHIIGMMFLAAAMVVTTSCNKDKTKMVSSFDLTFPEVEGVSALEDNKAYIDLVSNTMKWYNGDQVRVYSIDENYTNSKTAVYDGQVNMTGQLVGHFTGTPLPQGSVGYFVFYPADKATGTIAEGNRAYFQVGNTQTCATDLYAGTSYSGRIFMDPQGVVAASTCDAQVNGRMQHIFGIVTVRLKDSNNSGKKVKSVSITDSSRNLTGSISFEIPQLTESLLNGMKTLGQNYKNGAVNPESYAASLNSYLQQIGYMSEPNGNTVTLDCSAANGITINNTYKFFTMMIRPGTLMGGFTITITYDDDTTKDFVVPADKKYVVIPGTYTNISVDLANGVI